MGVSTISSLLKAVRLSALALVGASIVATARAEPVVNEKRTFYKVTGKTEEEIDASMDRRGPPGRFHAVTHHDVSWKFWWHDSSRGCKIFMVGTTVEIEFVLPRLQNKATLSPKLKRDWDRFYEALTRHENRHAENVVAGAREIERKIVAMGSRNTCAQLEVDANRIGKRVSAKSRSLNKAYDRKTNHGMREGAAWPPK